MSVEVPISVILSTLDTPRPGNLQYILKTLYSNSSLITQLSKSELSHLISRVNNLIQSKDEYKRWYGLHLVQVLAFNPVILTTGGAAILVSLIKLVNDRSYDNVLLFQNACLAISQIVKNIRGKPSLTREVLTPNLSNIIAALIDNFERDVATVLQVATDLLLRNTTTFKPFINKFEVKLTALLNNANFATFDDKLQAAVCKAYAYLNLTKSSNQASSAAATNSNVQALPDDQWRLRIFQIVEELKEVVQLYENLIDLSADANINKQLLSLGKLENSKKIFGKLSVDVNDSSTILQISQRVGVLTRLLAAFLTSATPFALRAPLGLAIKVATLLISISTSYIPVKREFGRESGLGKVIQLDVAHSQAHGVVLLRALVETYKFNVLSSSHLIFSSLEVIIPVTKSGKVFKIDDARCLNLESELLQVIGAVSELLQLNGHISDFEVIYKLIDASLLLLKKRTPLDELIDKQQQSAAPQGQGQGQGKKNKNKRNKDATPMSDILSHSALFELSPSKSTVKTVSSFFAIVIRKLNKINISYRIKLIKYIVSVSLKQYLACGKISHMNVKLLEDLVLYPNDFENFNNLAIVKNLLPNNQVLSLLTNPRFPVLDSKVKQRLESQYADLEEEEEQQEDEDEELAETAVEQLPHTSNTTLAEEIDRRTTSTTASNSANTPMVEVFKSNSELKKIQEQQSLTFAKEEPSTASKRQFQDSEMVEDSIPVAAANKKAKLEQQTAPTTATADQSDDEGSDFEMPVIDIDSDDEE
ncbi:hypothetical protein WICPIJ_002799 [Wickerhamomyces pijperi]|uniref:Pre-rRNA-processing protein RIX1 n=1 Tax=Wickerhamomyces pijperi TaxID=599730 RepID=A0A9P8TPB1_WICPI|nr:hypothetical protein WICPIJ_002799 [Wickerhamomyces pijperi]